MAKDYTLDEFKEGERLSATKLNKMRKALQQVQGLQGGFVSGDLALTRRIESGDDAPIRLSNCSNGDELVAGDTESKDGSGFLSDNIGKVASISGSCYTIVEVVDDCTKGTCVTVDAILDDCSTCDSVSGSCWQFSPCSDGSTFKARGPGFAQYEDKIVKWLDDDNCYRVTSTPDCSGAVTYPTSNVTASFTSCDDCDECALLTSCVDSSEIYVPAYQVGAFPDLVEGQVMKVDGVCYTITDVHATCPGDETDLGGIFKGPYSPDCNTCNCHKFEDCDSSAVIYVNEAKHANGDPFDLDSLEEGNTLRQGTLTCWEYKGTESDSDLCENAILLDDVQEEYDTCGCCTAYELGELDPACPDDGGYVRTITTNSDLCEYSFSDVLKRSDIGGEHDGKCYEVTGTTDFSGGDVEFIVESRHDSCRHCQVPLYLLVDANCATDECECRGEGIIGLDRHITDEDLLEAVGKMIQYDGTCWDVTVIEDEDLTLAAPIEWCGPFTSCNACQAEKKKVTIIVDIDWENKRVYKEEWILTGSKCDESDEEIPTNTC